MRLRVAAAAATALSAVVALPPAAAAPSRSQLFFKQKLLDDRRTSDAIEALLRTGGGFVDRSIKFTDLTGDDKTDAIVRVQSGGIDGVVAVYVLSTDTRARGNELRVVLRRQALRRGSTRVVDGALSYRTSIYDADDGPCCPSSQRETTLRWVARDKRFVVGGTEDLPGPS